MKCSCPPKSLWPFGFGHPQVAFRALGPLPCVTVLSEEQGGNAFWTARSWHKHTCSGEMGTEGRPPVPYRDNECSQDMFEEVLSCPTIQEVSKTSSTAPSPLHIVCLMPLHTAPSILCRSREGSRPPSEPSPVSHYSTSSTSTEEENGSFCA